MSKQKPSFWSQSINEWYKKLNTSANGLTEAYAHQVLLKAGIHKKVNPKFKKDLMLLVGQFKSPLMLLLIGAVILSAFLGDTSDVFIILFIVLSTGLLSFFQERNAGKVVEKLQSMLSIKSLVLRDGKEVKLDSDFIIPGDVLVLNAGDMVPADCLVIESNELFANEASLTGESFPVRKQAGVVDANAPLAQRTNTVWEGTSIVSGTAKVLVIEVGTDTIFGGIAQSATATTETTFEKGIKDFGFFLMKITLVLSVFILVVNLFNHKSPLESALFALALAVGMAPELLPAITTIAMSAGAKRMLDKKVIVKKLTSIQNLGEVNLLCTDKTGTITEGVIQIAGLNDAFGQANDFVKQIAFWNAKFETGYSNPIDEALRQLNLPDSTSAEKIAEVPYDFIRKRLSIAVKADGQTLLISKGAFKQVFEICTQVRLQNGSIANLATYKDEITQRYDKYGFDGLRAIAICYKPISATSISKSDECDMIFAGFILLQDPVKPGIIETITALSKLSVALKIITGDNINVAKSIAGSIGINNPQVITGGELLSTSPEALSQLVQHIHIFAEVEPQQKESIIRALRKTYAVAYIGDGINDVSAINAADVGISVSNAVDVAREAADFVLMEKDLMVLADGIEEGRKTFANTLKYIFINTGSTFGNMFSVAIASLILPFLPMLPKQILLTNFLTDFPYLTVASDNVDEEQVAKPGRWNIKVIRNYMVVFGIHSSLFDVVTFVTLLYVLKVKESAFQTGWFIESILTELFILFIIRTHKSVFKSKPGKYLFILSVLALAITLVLPYLPLNGSLGLVPLPPAYLGAMLTIVAAYIITADLLKIWFFKRYGNSNS